MNMCYDICIIILKQIKNDIYHVKPFTHVENQKYRTYINSYKIVINYIHILDDKILYNNISMCCQEKKLI